MNVILFHCSLHFFYLPSSILSSFHSFIRDCHLLDKEAGGFRSRPSPLDSVGVQFMGGNVQPPDLWSEDRCLEPSGTFPIPYKRDPATMTSIPLIPSLFTHDFFFFPLPSSWCGSSSPSTHPTPEETPRGVGYWAVFYWAAHIPAFFVRLAL